MADLAKRIISPQYLPTTTGALYTVPVATTTIVRNIHVANVSAASSYTFSLAIGTATVLSNCLYNGIFVPAYGAFDWSGFLVLAAGDVLHGLASNASVLVINASGIEASE